MVRFKYEQIAKHRKDSVASLVHAVHDPPEEKKKEEDEEDNRNKDDFDQIKSRYYLITQNKKDDGTIEFNVKHFTFNINKEDKPEPENCEVKK